jgi:hypothetical protein
MEQSFLGRSAAMAFPKTINEVTPDWLSTVLGAEVVDFDKHFLPGGVLSDTYKLDIRYAPGANSAPQSAVIKLATEIAKQRDLAITNGAYLKELRFFQEVAAEVPIKVPEVYAIDDDGSADAENFMILMEDLSSHSTVFDQLSDPPDEPFLRSFCDDMANLHGTFWGSERLNADWISESDGRYVFTVDAICRECEENLDEFRHQWRSIYDRELFDEPEAPGTRALSETVAGPKAVAILDFMSDRLNERPKTLLHGDLRADNIFRTTGKTAEEATLTFIDWQLVSVGPPGPDFTQAWAHSLPPATRRKDLELLKAYHTSLLQVDPAASAYTYDMLVEDYLFGYLLWWQAVISALAASLPGLEESADGERMRAFYKQAVYYMLVAMEDHDCLDLARKIAAQV